MNHKDLLKLLSKNHKFIFIGEEFYLAGYALNFLKSALNPEFLLFNYIEMEQKDIAYADCMLKIESVPMMDNKKIVHIKNFNFAVDSNSWSKKDLEDFGEKISHLPADCVLILSNESISKPGNLKLIKDYGKIMSLISFDRLNNKDLTDFLQERFTDSVGSGAVSREVLAKFVQVSGYLQKESKINLHHIEGMASKIEAYYREYGKVDLADIEFLFETPPDGDIFRLIDAIASGNKKEAFRHYSGLRTKGEANIKIMVTIGKIFSTAVRVSYYLEEGYDNEEIARELKKSPYAVSSARNLIRKSGREQLIAMIEAIVEVDYAMKTGMMDESVYGEMALMRIFEIIHPEKIG